MSIGYRYHSVQPRIWAVANTRPHKEHIALENLTRQDFRAYCPVVRKSVRHARQVRDALRPLFPGYLFVEVNQDLQCWRPILSTFGVRTLVHCGEQLCVIDEGFVQSLKAREIDGAIVRPTSPYKVGQRVRLANGPFEGLVANIIEMDQKDRLLVLMDLLGRPVRVRVDSRSVTMA